MEFKFAPGVAVPQNGGGNYGSERLEEMVKVTSSTFLRTPGPPPPPARAGEEGGGESSDDEELDMLNKTNEDEDVPDLIEIPERPRRKKVKVNAPSPSPNPAAPAGQRGGDGGQRGGGASCFQLFLYFILTVAFFALSGLMLNMYVPQISFGATPLHVGRRGTTFPLWPSNLVRKGLRFSNSGSVPKHILADLEHSFYSHLSATPNTFACLCMHHLQTNSLPMQKICAIHNPYMQRVHLLVDAKIVGHGEQTDLYEEKLISEETVRSHVKRYRTVFVQWSDAGTGDVLTLQLQGMQAVCMQVAVEEFSPSSAAA